MTILLTQYTSIVLLLILITLVIASKSAKPAPQQNLPVPLVTPTQRTRIQQQLMKTSDIMHYLRQHFLTASDTSHLATSNRAIHNVISNVVEEEANKLRTKLVEIFRENPTEELTGQMEELTNRTNEPLLKWLYRLYRMKSLAKLTKRTKDEPLSKWLYRVRILARKENETDDEWQRRVESLHRKLLEKEALTALYDNTNGDGWDRSDLWDMKTYWKTDVDICRWDGVTCTKGSVTELNLRKNKLSGPIPKEIGQLTNLIDLRLYDNKLSGPIPTEIGQLTNLEKMWLTYNKLSGSIPKEIRQLSQLTYMDLRFNKLTGYPQKFEPF